MKERNIKLGATALAVALAVVTAIALIGAGMTDRLLLAAGTVILVLLPWGMEKLFRCRICLPVYIFALLYALGPMLGHCWYFYYKIPWWDKLLHTCGGVMFAILGVYFFRLLLPNEEKPLASALFGLFFSVAIAAVWEFVEFGADCLLGTDMQNDRVVTGICSYLLGDSLGMTGSIQNIQMVTINGAPLPVDGYLDIGLIDTMFDMILESIGAVITCMVLWLDRGRHPLVVPVKQTEKKNGKQ